MKLRDALYNWLQMEIVATGRPQDRAALETRAFFAEMLEEDHQVSDCRIRDRDSRFIYVEYKINGEPAEERFERELAEQLLHDINANPKFNE